MDCDKFDNHVMDALYGELDELTFEALKRHVEGCPRCAGVWSSLKSTRAAAVLPLEDPPSGLEAKILAAEKTVHGRAPWPRKIMRAAAWAGSHAMRPQLAMAALFMFVIGSSLLLLRSRPGAPVTVSEQGRPEIAQNEESERERGVGRAASPAPATKGYYAGEDGAARGDKAERASGGAEAPPAAAAATASAVSIMPGAAPTDEGDATGAGAQGLLAEARKTRDASGCDAAVPGYLGVISSFPDSEESKTAAREVQACKQTAAKAPPPTATATVAPTTSASGKPAP